MHVFQLPKTVERYRHWENDVVRSIFRICPSLRYFYYYWGWCASKAIYHGDDGKEIAVPHYDWTKGKMAVFNPLTGMLDWLYSDRRYKLRANIFEVELD